MPDLTVKVRAVEKLLDYAASGVGAIAGPMLANWKAAKEGRARLTSARIDADVRRIEAESNAQSLVIIAEAQAKARKSVNTTTESESGVVKITREDITQSIEFQGRKRLANVASVVEDTANQLGDKEVSDHEPDPDWTARFFDCVQDVSSDDMQKIWARVLAGEVESPGRTSLRTLDTLRNMTNKDAVMFRVICDFIINHDFIFYDDTVKTLEELNYSTLLHLQDCGLVNVGPNLVKEFRREKTADILLPYGGGVLMITWNQHSGIRLAIPDILLTTAGKEIYGIAERAFHMEYMQRFAKFLETKKCQLFYLEGTVALPDGRLFWTKRVSIEPKPIQ